MRGFSWICSTGRGQKCLGCARLFILSIGINIVLIYLINPTRLRDIADNSKNRLSLTYFGGNSRDGSEHVTKNINISKPSHEDIHELITVRTLPPTTARTTTTTKATTSTARKTQASTTTKPTDVKPTPALPRKERFKVLLWLDKYAHPVVTGRAGFRMCKFSNCDMTGDKTELNTSDAVLYFIRQLPPEVKSGLSNYTGARPPAQKWIVELIESPANNKVNLTMYNGMFNATLSYSSKSDVQDTRLEIREKSQPDEKKPLSDSDFAGKSKFIAWFVSNCNTRSKRDRFVDVLKEYVPIDIYGRCGNLKCQKSGTWDQGRSDKDECMQMLNEKYKFFLSFENSLCTDYYTEKVMNILKLNVVPIVLGGANYKDILPPKSYIDVKDFASVKDLASYLKKLDKNRALYEEYFEWKRTYLAVQSRNVFCATCRFLNEDRDKRNIVKSLDKHWSEQDNCVSPEKYYSSFSENILA